MMSVSVFPYYKVVVALFILIVGSTSATRSHNIVNRLEKHMQVPYCVFFYAKLYHIQDIHHHQTIWFKELKTGCMLIIPCIRRKRCMRTQDVNSDGNRTLPVQYNATQTHILQNQIATQHNTNLSTQVHKFEAKRKGA